jgi:hypothetical protein
MRGDDPTDHLKGRDMSDFPVDLKDEVPASRRTREPTKLECGLLGALSATIGLGFLFWLGVQLSILRLIVQIT